MTTRWEQLEARVNRAQALTFSYTAVTEEPVPQILTVNGEPLTIHGEPIVFGAPDPLEVRGGELIVGDSPLTFVDSVPFQQLEFPIIFTHEQERSKFGKVNSNPYIVGKIGNPVGWVELVYGAVIKKGSFLLINDKKYRVDMPRIDGTGGMFMDLVEAQEDQPGQRPWA